MNKKARVTLLCFSVFALLAVFSIMYLALASHTVTVFDGTTNFSVAEDVTTLYNISINNSDAGGDANITRVNMTLWGSNFVFLANSNVTDIEGSQFTNTSVPNAVLNWENLTDYLINGSGELKYFSFNATASTPGTYNIR